MWHWFAHNRCGIGSYKPGVFQQTVQKQTEEGGRGEEEEEEEDIRIYI